MVARAGIEPIPICPARPNCNRTTREAGTLSLLSSWELRAHVTQIDKSDASNFADWVFHQTYPNASKRPDVRAKDLDRGRLGHETVLNSICKSHDFKVKVRRKTSPGDWRPTFVDNEANDHTYLASTLRVDGLPMRCRPDMIFENRTRSAVMIVEYKMTFFGTATQPRKAYTRKSFDPEGYPNNRAQLWCYSHIDDFRDVSEVLLVLQFWDATTFENKATLTWLRPDQEIEQEARRFFVRYGGEIHDP
jgi:hypothetical protein